MNDCTLVGVILEVSTWNVGFKGILDMYFVLVKDGVMGNRAT